eukprot:Skav232246  [mRNA]  locus=scaffold273:65099:65963:+ [translate_table: standard]
MQGDKQVDLRASLGASRRSISLKNLEKDRVLNNRINCLTCVSMLTLSRRPDRVWHMPFTKSALKRNVESFCFK